MLQDNLHVFRYLFYPNFIIHCDSNLICLLIVKALSGADLGGGCRECAPPPPPPEMTCRFLIQLHGILPKKKTMWFIGVEVEQETSAPPPKKILDPPLAV